LRRKCVSIQELKRHLAAGKPALHRPQPRWVRINTLKTTLEEELAGTFEEYRSCTDIATLTEAGHTDRMLLLDPHVPNLIALSPGTDVTKTEAYHSGRIILQDKASCFPAHLLVGESEKLILPGDCIDGCAAPGNKTSHIAALLAANRPRKHKQVVYACERDPRRSEILQTLMKKSGADTVQVMAKCDFLTLNPQDEAYLNVTHVLLDPSCSGSGILGREDIPSLALPIDPKEQKPQVKGTDKASKKRKRGHDRPAPRESEVHELTEVEETRDGVVDKERLRKLSDIQTKIVEHGLSFPAAVRVTYSTCSTHAEENEAVVARVLASSIAKERGWRLLHRDEQVSGLQQWPHRGVSIPMDVSDTGLSLDECELSACIRCHPGDAEGTMGFFVCCFTREVPAGTLPGKAAEIEGHDGWEGFSD
jgi:25S rRNA (cytosine2278-C5)-methyltransferase